MTLGGDQVVELDFQSMHVALAYNLCRARLNSDPYEAIPGFTRKQAKAALLTAFNAVNMHAAVASLTDGRQGRRVCATQFVPPKERLIASWRH